MSWTAGRKRTEKQVSMSAGVGAARVYAYGRGGRGMLYCTIPYDAVETQTQAVDGTWCACRPKGACSWLLARGGARCVETATGLEAWILTMLGCWDGELVRLCDAL